MTDPRDELERQIFANLDDPAAYLVYGDWLQARGDPRGSLIALQAAGAPLAVTEAELIAAHREVFLGEALDPPPSIEWFLGFWRALLLTGDTESEPPPFARVEPLLRLTSARFLRELSLRVGLEPGDTLGAIAALHRTLGVLSLSVGDALDDDRVLALREMTALTDVQLRSCRHVTARGLAGLRDLPRLELLALVGCELDADGAAMLGSIAQLRRLVLMSDTLDDRALDEVARLGGLHALDLGFCEALTDAACVPIARLTALRFLSLRSTEITAVGLRRLHGLALRSLDLGFAVLAAEELDVLLGFPDLSELALGYVTSALRDAAVDVIVQLEQLTTLCLASAEITPAAIDRLAALPRLRTIGLHNCPVNVIERAHAVAHWEVVTDEMIDLTI